MADWRDVMEARGEADRIASTAVDARTPDADAYIAALLAIRAELRALGTMIDYATPYAGGKVNGVV